MANFLKNELERRRKLMDIAVPEFSRVAVLENDRVLQVQKALVAPLAEQTQRISQFAALVENVNPLKYLEERLTSIGLALAPFARIDLSAVQAHMVSFQKIAIELDKRFEEHTLLLRNFMSQQKSQQFVEAAFARLALVEKINIELPELALRGWTMEIARERFGLIEDSLRNIAAVQEVQTGAVLSNLASEPVEVATDFVWNHGSFVRRLPPMLRPSTEPPHDSSQELGAKLELRLHEINPRLAELRRQAWKNLADGKAGARLAAHGIREILGELLRLFASDENVKKTASWIERKDQALLRPTRRMRFEYIAGSTATELAALIQFEESVARANKFAHIFADDIEVVRAYLAQLEACIYLLIIYANASHSD